MPSDLPLDSSGERAEAAFAKLPSDLQERIRSEGDAIGVRVSDHVVQILIGIPGGQAPPQDAKHASGVIAFTGTRLCLFTAHHVLEKFRELHAHNPRVVFQAGNVSFNPEPRVLFESSGDDLVVLGMNGSDQLAIEALTWKAPRWPPAVPREGEFVAFAGLPVDYRINEPTGEVNFAIVGGLLRVISATGRSFRCHMNRDTIIRTRGAQVPPPGTRLWGMSGGPVFRFEGGDLELTGVITDFGEDFEVFLMTPLAVADTLVPHEG